MALPPCWSWVAPIAGFVAATAAGEPLPSPLLPQPVAAFLQFADRSAEPTGAHALALPSHWRFTIPATTRPAGLVAARIPTDGPVAAGDALLLRFRARTLEARQETGEGAITVSFRHLDPAGGSSLRLRLTPSTEWTQFELPFAAARLVAAGDGELEFAFGDVVQVLELADIELLNYGTTQTVADLPRTRFTYDGREPEAAWRAEALRRIESLRTARFQVRVVDGNDAPVPEAAITATLIRPAFWFGSAVAARWLLTEGDEADTYRRIARTWFDTVTIDNALKWPAWRRPSDADGSPNRAEALAAIAWIERHDLRLRGHTLVWPGWNWTPSAVRNLPDRAERLQSLVVSHIVDIVTATRGRIAAWDVLNEPVHERAYFAELPEAESVALWFRLTRALDPKPLLFVNDYGMLNQPASPATIRRLRELVALYRAAGAPIDAIGVQGHLGAQPRPPRLVLSDLDSLAEEGLPIQITEFDVDTADEELQADITRDFLIACYSHPAVTGFIKWGFWEGSHWRPQAAMFRRDWSEKPNAAVWREWVLGRWRTRVETVADAAGQADARGHCGTYRIVARLGSREATATGELGPAGATWIVRLP